MPPRKKEETAAAWATRADGTPINPNSSEGMVLSGELRPRAPQAPYTEALEPANAAALLAATPDADGATTLAKEPPAGVEFFKLHVADEKFPEARRVGLSCSSWRSFLASSLLLRRVLHACSSDARTLPPAALGSSPPRSVLEPNRCSPAARFCVPRHLRELSRLSRRRHAHARRPSPPHASRGCGLWLMTRGRARAIRLSRHPFATRRASIAIVILTSQAPAMLACNCMSDQLEDVLEAMMGTRGGGPSEPECVVCLVVVIVVPRLPARRGLPSSRQPCHRAPLTPPPLLLDGSPLVPSPSRARARSHADRRSFVRLFVRAPPPPGSDRRRSRRARSIVERPSSPPANDGSRSFARWLGAPLAPRRFPSRRYRNPKSGLEFEWVVPPANFYDKAAPGWEAGKMAEDVQAEGDDADDRE